jgi:23S rRNA (uracil1939-C5)-methyltransferase
MPLHCPHHEACGACVLLARPYEVQLGEKRERLAVALADYPDLAAAAVRPTLPAPELTGYRRRAKLVVGPRGELGLYGATGDHVVVDIPGCVVLSPALTHVSRWLRASLRSGALSLGRGSRLFAIDLREADEHGAPAVLVTLVVEGAGTRALEPARSLAARIVEQLPAVRGVACNVRPRRSAQILGPTTLHLAGAGALRDGLDGVFTLATFGAFAQASRGGARLARELLSTAIRSTFGSPAAPRVLELYGGSGAIGLALAAAGARVTMVESFAPAAEQAARAAAEQGLSKRFHVKSAGASAATEALLAAGERFDLVVANPPRRGLGPRVRALLARAAPRAVAYLSCDPDTLARDLDHLRRLGLAPAWLQPFDMIPLTDHVETLAWLQSAEAAAPRVLAQAWSGRAEARFVDKPAHHRAHELDDDLSGVCLVARPSVDRPHRIQRSQYVLACRGRAPDQGVLPLWVGKPGRSARRQAVYARIGRVGTHSLLSVVLAEAGVSSLCRALAEAGHPVLGDARFGDERTNRHFAEKYGLDRPFLHRVALCAEHPRNGSCAEAESPLPGELRSVLRRAAVLHEHRRELSGFC